MLADWWGDRTPQEKLRFEFLLASLAVIAVLLVGALLIWLAGRWFRQPGSATRDSADLQMSTFRELYERGELSRQEYDRIKSKLGARLLPADARKPVVNEVAKPQQDDAVKRIDGAPDQPPAQAPPQSFQAEAPGKASPPPPNSAEPPGAETSPT
jgi:hypothetical protein